MDRNREARRGSMAAMNGGLSRRRQQRSTNLRDSPEEDGVMEMRESSRLRDRDRGIKKDRDRSGGGSRSKRRRGERLIHGSNRDEGDDSSEESLDDEDDEEEEEAAVSVRFPPPPPPPTNPTPSSSSSLQQQQQQQSQNNHVRRSITSKLARPPAPSWKVAEEMIGVSIPRKARTSTLKRPQECGGGGSGELIHRQASTSPSRRSPSSNTAVSPSSSNVSVRKKKPISGSKHRPPKSKSSSIQEIEIEVAEVLYGMTRQAPAPPVLSSSMQDTNGLSNEAKSIPRVSSPGSFSPPTSQPSVLPTPNLNSSNNSAPLVTTAPKRKRPRLKSEDESPTSPAMKPETELPPKPEEGSAPVSPSRSEKKMAAAAAYPAIENGSTALTDVCTAAGGDHMQESAKPESSGHVPEQKEAKEEIVLAATSKSKEAPCSNLNAKLDEATVVKDGSEAMKVDSPREEKFSIDLMAPPPPSLGNSERDGLLDYASDHKSVEPVKEMRLDIAKGEMEKLDRSSKQQEANEAASAEDIVNKHVPTEKPMLDLQLDLEKQDKDAVSLGSSSKHQQQSKQQPKVPRIDPKQEKKAQSAASSSLPLTMPIAGWPGGFPHFGYMGQGPTLPAVMPMDGSSAASKTLQPPHFFPPQKMKRCATHCYIAKTINYNQQIARMNPFWPPAAAAAAAAAVVGTSPMYGAKQHNLNLVPPPEAAILGNPLQGSFPGRSLGPLQEKASPAVAMTYAASPPAKEKSSAAAAAAAANNPLIEAQRKQFLLQQTPQPVSSAAGPNMLHGPAAFIFPVGQQPAAAAAATRPGTAKSTPGIGNAAPSTASGSSIAASSGPAGHSTTTMSFNYSGLQPSESQYLAFLQNNGYALTMPAHLGGGPPYRGANPSQAMPFFNGSFYSSPMLHPSSQQQFRQQQQQQQQQSPATHQQPPAHSQQGHQNTSTSSGSSSSQKHHTKQQQRAPGGGAAAGATPAGGNNHNFSAKQHLHLLPPQARQLESEAGCEDSPSTADSSRASQAQKSIYGNFAMSIHPQNFAMLSPAAAALPSSGSGGGGSHNDKQQPVQNQANLTPSQAYAMSFAPFGGPAAAAAAGGAQGLDFTSMVQNHALFHSLPESVRHHGYQQITAVAAAAVAAQLAQHKKSHHEDGKSVGDAGAASANVTSEEGKMMASTGKSPGGVAQHSLSFSRPDNDLKASTILGNNSNIPEGSSRTLNLIQPPANGVRASNRPSSAAPATSSPVVANTANPTAGNLHMQSSQQQQQHLIQLQKSQQQQQQLQLQQQMSSRSTTKGSSHSTNNATIYSDRMAAGSMSRFSGFPPSIIQSASPAQSPQWKASGRSATPGPANSATTSSSSAKNQLQQQQQQQHHQHQQGRNQQQHQQALLGSNVHQTQISFGVSSSKAVGVSGQPLLASNSSLAAASAAAAAIAAGSPQSSVSKSSAGNGGGGGSGGNGSPRASSSSKPGQPPPTLLSPALPLHQQPPPAAKNSPSPSSSNLKSSSPANNRNMTSILGHPQITPAANSSSSTKFQQQQQQQQKQQSFHQPQLFFSHPYLQAAQSSQSNAAAAHANFYQQQRRHSEQQSQQHSQQQQQQQQNSTSSGVLSLCPSSLTLAGSSPTSDPAKAARPKPQGDQKAAPGSENLHWKPEKR